MSHPLPHTDLFCHLALPMPVIMPVSRNAGALGGLSLPWFTSQVAAGFPSPCDDHIEKRINVHDYLVDNDAYTFVVTVVSDLMVEAGILPRDKVLVDRSKDAKPGDIVLAVVDGEFTLQQLSRSANGKAALVPANRSYQPLEIRDGIAFEIWGVVVASIRKY